MKVILFSANGQYELYTLYYFLTLRNVFLFGVGATRQDRRVICSRWAGRPYSAYGDLFYKPPEQEARQ